MSDSDRDALPWLRWVEWREALDRKIRAEIQRRAVTPDE
jgi:hypothetical protein